MKKNESVVINEVILFGSTTEINENYVSYQSRKGSCYGNAH
jgi:hypothetical protein